MIDGDYRRNEQGKKTGEKDEKDGGLVANPEQSMVEGSMPGERTAKELDEGIERRLSRFPPSRTHAQGKTEEDRQIKTERDPEEAGDGTLDEKAALKQFRHADPGLERSWKDVRTPRA